MIACGNVLPLLAPCLVAVPVLHFAYRFLLRGRDRAAARRIAVVATPLAFLAVHVAFFGTSYLGGQLLILIGLAGGLYGGAFGLVRTQTTR